MTVMGLEHHKQTVIVMDFLFLFQDHSHQREEFPTDGK